MNSVSAKVFKGAIWLTLSRAIVNALGFVSTFVLARYLTPNDFGVVAIATSVLAIAMSITDLSLTSALVQRAELEEEHFHSVWTISVIRALLIFASLALLAWPLSKLYGDPRLVGVLIAAGAVAALPGLKSPKLAILTRRLVFWQEFAVTASGRLISVGVAIAIAIIYRSYWALLISNIVANAVIVIISYAIAPYLPKVSFSKFKELISFSLWMSLGETITTLNYRFDQLALGFLTGQHSLGLYTVADNLSSVPVRESTTPLTQTLFPAFSRMAADPARLQEGLTRAQLLLFAIAMPVGFGFALTAAPVVHVFLGAKWVGAIPIIQILSATFAVATLSASLEPLAMAMGATKVLFGRDVRTFLIRIPFLVTGYLTGGLMGVVIARAVSSTVGTVWNMALISTLSGVTIARQFRGSMRVIIATVVMVAVGVAFQGLLAPTLAGLPQLLVIGLTAGLGATTYVGSTVALWLAAGKPKGPESEILGLANRVLASRLRLANS
jgi:O-antigen/teichoic acid export membrane protein